MLRECYFNLKKVRVNLRSHLAWEQLDLMVLVVGLQLLGNTSQGSCVDILIIMVLKD